ncbi:lipoprotein [Spiroplasma endosymbiont of Ammophila pubescens]|uniref:lipoprotein n=1 Tax=Spiroplasma endosymbiont of Ammophila pubescens TaxID=3066315 RepID=UPI0032B26FF6
MKNLLTILGTIGLTATSTTSLISCEKPNNSENGEDNKPEPTTEPEQPPVKSNWKLITDKYIPRDTGWYIISYKWFGEFNIIKVNSSEKYGNDINKIIGSSFNNYENINIYKWNLDNEPMGFQLPKININTGEITDWKG